MIMKKDKIQTMDLDSLINKLGLKDTKYKNMMKRFQIMFFIFIFLYAGLFIINPDSDLTIYDRIAGICYVVAFTLFTIQFRILHKKFKQVNYSDPVKKVLEDAKKRYRLWHKNHFIIGFAILCIDAATILVLFDQFTGQWTLGEFVLIVQGFYVLVIGIGFFFGYLRWKSESKPIWLSAKALLKDLEE